MICAGIYYIASGAYGDNKEAAQSMMQLQQIFELIYGANLNKQKEPTNGETAKVKHEYLMYLSEVYDNNATEIIQLEMGCNLWREALMQPFINMIENANTWNDVVKESKTFPKKEKIVFTDDDARWNSSVMMMNLGFQYWDSQGRLTPFSVKEELLNK
mgnify:CR=1 FL=1